MTTAIVTGGAGTIGAAICETLAARGDQVLCADLELARFERRFAETDGGLLERITFVQTDVTDEAAWESLCDTAAVGPGGLGALVNVAYASTLGAIDKMDHETWRRCFDVTLHATALGVHVAGKRMAAAGQGAIVNIASVVAHGGAPVNAGYATAKSAVLGLTRSAAARLGRKGVRVNAVSPGWVESPAVRSLFRAQARGEVTEADAREAFVATIPMQRLAEPRDIAEAVAFLTSDAARYVTGIELTVDGGLSVA